MKKLKHLPLLIAIVCLLFACSDVSNESQEPTRSLEKIKTTKSLVVLTQNSPTTYYLGKDGSPQGPEFEMVESFANYLGVEVTYKQLPSIAAIIEGVEAADGDMAAAGLTITDARKSSFLFGPAYQDVTQQVVCRRDNVQPESIADLEGLSIVVASSSSYSEQLNNLKEEHTFLSWIEQDNASSEQLLYSVWKKEFDCTIADSNIVDINRRYFPELIAPMNIDRSQGLGWMMSHERKDLQAAIEEWFEDYKKSGRLAAMLDQYYGFFEVFDYVDTRKFIKRIKQRLPKYQNYFKQASEKYDIPFNLLAAQAYQESHWRANAKSPTGVRGVMMLTQNTAKAMGVSNRLDPKQSIFGGAKYLAKLKKDRFSDEVIEPDRTWLALAAYNVGRAHLHDAQSLARAQGLNPHLWSDVKQVLPLLAEKRYYKDLKYGYARGMEPVRYVQRIREYEHILENELDDKKIEVINIDED